LEGGRDQVAQNEGAGTERRGGGVKKQTGWGHRLEGAKQRGSFNSPIRGRGGSQERKKKNPHK